MRQTNSEQKEFRNMCTVQFNRSFFIDPLLAWCCTLGFKRFPSQSQTIHNLLIFEYLRGKSQKTLNLEHNSIPKQRTLQIRSSVHLWTFCNIFFHFVMWKLKANSFFFSLFFQLLWTLRFFSIFINVIFRCPFLVQ